MVTLRATCSPAAGDVMLIDGGVVSAAGDCAASGAWYPVANARTPAAPVPHPRCWLVMDAPVFARNVSRGMALSRHEQRRCQWSRSGQIGRACSEISPRDGHAGPVPPAPIGSNPDRPATIRQIRHEDLRGCNDGSVPLVTPCRRQVLHDVYRSAAVRRGGSLGVNAAPTASGTRISPTHTPDTRGRHVLRRRSGRVALS
jgi:hypothetical protein